ncbi:hypothetical protein GA0115259_1050912 [Streptomyces sp. MnatMP-M17]|nr:hypothetical protein GA0115259_1050912 [Streptomyces sp. MnatMP-M17]
MLLDVSLTAVAYAMHWHRTRQNVQQQAAAEQTLIHLQTSYAQIAVPALTGLSSRAPSPQTKRRYAHHLQQAVPEHAERILTDPAWDAWPPCWPRRKQPGTTRPRSSTRPSAGARSTTPTAQPAH